MSAFLLMGILATAFAMIGHVQRGDIWTVIARIDGVVAATVGVCAVSGSIVSGVIGNRHYGGPWLTTGFVVAGLAVGALVGGAIWLQPPVAPVLTGCALVLLYAGVIRLRRGAKQNSAKSASHASDLV